jgi:hypothetical protein
MPDPELTGVVRNPIAAYRDQSFSPMIGGDLATHSSQDHGGELCDGR